MSNNNYFKYYVFKLNVYVSVCVNEFIYVTMKREHLNCYTTVTK